MAKHNVYDSLTAGTGEYIQKDVRGSRVRYYDFADSLPAAQRGQFKSYTDPSGNVPWRQRRIRHWGASSEVQRAVTLGGVMTIESFLYDYYTAGSFWRAE